jgi:hypothetical protein
MSITVCMYLITYVTQKKNKNHGVRGVTRSFKIILVFFLRETPCPPPACGRQVVKNLKYTPMVSDTLVVEFLGKFRLCNISRFIPKR